MLLILTNTEDATSSYLESVLVDNGFDFLRLNTDDLLRRTVVSYQSGVPAIQIDGVRYEPEQFKNVWYRRPEKLKDSRFDATPEGEFTVAEWSEALEGVLSHIPKSRWVNHPSCNAAASHKIQQLTTAAKFKLNVPDTLVTQDPQSLRNFFSLHSGAIITKPMANGYVRRSVTERDSLIYTNPVRHADLENLDDLCNCPTLFQHFISKQCDVRITIVDTDIHPVALIAQDANGGQRCDIRRNNMSDVTYQKIDLPKAVERGLLEMMAHYDLRFAAIDMVVSTKGEWYFLEINPNGQWAWLDISGAQRIAASFLSSFSEEKSV